jgi:hypothetical protein
MKLNFIHGIAFVLLLCILAFICFVSTNQYLNAVLFFFGTILVIYILAVGSDKTDKS